MLCGSVTLSQVKGVVHDTWYVFKTASNMIPGTYLVPGTTDVGYTADMQ